MSYRRTDLQRRMAESVRTFRGEAGTDVICAQLRSTLSDCPQSANAGPTRRALDLAENWPHAPGSPQTRSDSSSLGKAHGLYGRWTIGPIRLVSRHRASGGVMALTTHVLLAPLNPRQPREPVRQRTRACHLSSGCTGQAHAGMRGLEGAFRFSHRAVFEATSMTRGTVATHAQGVKQEILRFRDGDRPASIRERRRWRKQCPTQGLCAPSQRD